MDSSTDIERASARDLLRLVSPRVPAELLERVGGLEAMARAEPFELAANVAGDRQIRAADRRAGLAVAAAFELGRRAAVEASRVVDRIRAPADVVAWARPRLASLPHEELWVLALDGRGGLRGGRCVARGGLHGAALRASDPLRAALRMGASAFVLVHNHPSGDPSPSPEDVALTREIAWAARVVGMPLLDHLVVARDGYAVVPVLEHDEDPPTGAPDGNGR